MSPLTEALERIRNHHLEHNPKLVEKLKPGLTRKEIDEVIKDLPFPFPEELYELYQWHNGMEGAYPVSWLQFINAKGGVYGFLSLEDAIKMSREEYKSVSITKYGKYEPNWLIIFSSASDNNALGLVIILGEETAPIRCYDEEDNFYEIIHSSLTNMMLNNVLRNIYAPHDDLNGADLRKADLRGICLRETEFKHTNLECADLRGANLLNTDLSTTNLKGAKLKDALYSINTKFPDGTDLSELIFIGAGANLQGVNLENRYLGRTNLKGADLGGASLKKSYLAGANLENANLTGANLEKAYLEKTNLKGANLTNANLKEARFIKTNLTNVNLSNINLSNYQIEHSNAIVLNTIMPDGTIKNPQDLDI
ncbi:MAG: pentapeptide repeat-containing protein [Cyanobacteria bacterium J06633_8]